MGYVRSSLTKRFESDPHEQEFLVLLLKQWNTHIKQSELSQLSPERCASITKEFLHWMESDAFKHVWKLGRKDSAEYEKIRYELLYVIALYSDKTDDIWPFIEEVKSKSARREKSHLSVLDPEVQILSVMYRDKEHKIVKPLLFRDETEYSELVTWFRERLNITEAYKLVRKKHSNDKLLKRACHDLLRRYRQYKKRGLVSSARLQLQNAAETCPNSLRIRYLAKKSGLSPAKPSRKRTSRDLLSLLKSPPLLAFLGFCLLVCIYVFQRIIALIKEAQVPGNNLLGTITHSIAVPQLLFLILYIFLAYILFRSLTEPLMPEPLRTTLMVTFAASALPTITSDVWSKIIGLPDYQLGVSIIIAAFFVCVFIYRDTYRDTRNLIQDAGKAVFRTIVSSCFIIGQELIYALMFSDFVGRTILFGTSQSQIDAQKLTNDYLWGIIPKLIILSPLPDFHMYVFPPIIVLLSLTPFVLGTIQAGIMTLHEGFYKIADA